MNLIIDIGNTVAKLAAFDGDELLEVVHGNILSGGPFSPRLST